MSRDPHEKAKGREVWHVERSIARLGRCGTTINRQRYAISAAGESMGRRMRVRQRPLLNPLITPSNKTDHDGIILVPWADW